MGLKCEFMMGNKIQLLTRQKCTCTIESRISSRITSIGTMIIWQLKESRDSQIVLENNFIFKISFPRINTGRYKMVRSGQKPESTEIRCARIFAISSRLRPFLLRFRSISGPFPVRFRSVSGLNPKNHGPVFVIFVELVSNSLFEYY